MWSVSRKKEPVSSPRSFPSPVLNPLLLTSMASQVYLYFSAVAPPTILLTGPGIPQVLSVVTGGVWRLSQVWNFSPFLKDLASMIVEDEFDAALVRLSLGQQVIWHWNPL